MVSFYSFTLEKIAINGYIKGFEITVNRGGFEREDRGKALIKKVERIISEYSIVMLEISDFAIEVRPWKLAPSQKLMLHKSLSIGHEIIAAKQHSTHNHPHESNAILIMETRSDCNMLNLRF